MNNTLHSKDSMKAFDINLVTNTVIWGSYALVYDLILRRFIPYLHLMKEASGALNCFSGGHILDAGCGTGNFLQEIISLPLTKVVGLDNSSAMLKRAHKKLKGQEKLSLEKCDLNAPIPYAAEYFDAVVCLNVLYSTQSPSFTLNQLARVLKQGGRLVLVTPPVKPRMAPLISDHVRAFQKKHPLWWPIFSCIDLLWVLPCMPLFLIINLYIKRHHQFHFFEKAKLVGLARSAGFKVESVRKTYAGQDWFLIGKKVSNKNVSRR